MRQWLGTGLALIGAASAAPATAGDPIPLGSFHLAQPISIPLAREVRIRVAVSPTEPAWRVEGPLAFAHPNVGGALVDVFPFDDHFHLSAGGRLFSRNPARSADPESLQVLPALRIPGVRSSRRFNPAMLMGYSRTTAQGVALGFDAGVLMGQTDPAPDYRISDNQGSRAPGGVNGLARMTMRYRF